MDDKVGYVVLHYAVLEETANCVKSIVDTQRGANYCLIVVNNGDDRVEELEKMCHSLSDEIVLLHSKINSGFARGMNLGYCEAKYRQHCDFIVLLNNDTQMVQSDFSSRLIDEYYEKTYAVAGPKILKPDGSLGRRNPFRYGMQGFELIFLKYIMSVTKYAASFVNRDLWVGKWQRRLERRMPRKGMTVPPGSESWPRIDNCMLHGCCLIFSPQYIQKYDGLNPRTFLYVEEDILYARVLANGWTTAYLRNLSIIHIGNVSTDKVVSTIKAKRRFRYRHQIKSYGVLIRLMLGGKRARQKA